VSQSNYLVATALLVSCRSPHSASSADAARDSPADTFTADAPLDVAPDDTGMLPLTGDLTPVHDPSIIGANGLYYVFSTGDGLPIRSSPDLDTWNSDGQVFTTLPSWITTTDPSDPSGLWAPDISYWGGEFHVYYAASKFGVNTSCIGHATSPSLAPPSWTDHGPVICSTGSDDWNAIDPNVVIDPSGDPWLVFGSFWSGIKLIELSSSGARQGSAFYSLATRADTAVEGPFIVQHDAYYYLFESVGTCCDGSSSTYRMMVGRATALTGPYLDEAGSDLADGGGTQLVAGNSAWIGPGHDAIYAAPNGDWYNIYHALDASNAYTPTLRIAELQWENDWPVSAGP
jgi:arabinan endo-1,5-alpha-L-arabinosidase